MFDDNDNDDDGFELPTRDTAFTVSQLRDCALLAFDEMMSEHTGLKTPDPEELLDQKREYLSISETEAVVREFGVNINDEFMAVGGETREEAEEKVREVIRALGRRIMSNVLAEGTRAGLLDSAFDDETNGFVFRLTDKGKEFRDRVVKDLTDYTASQENSDDD
jgi:hypothetical protein